MHFFCRAGSVAVNCTVRPARFGSGQLRASSLRKSVSPSTVGVSYQFVSAGALSTTTDTTAPNTETSMADTDTMFALDAFCLRQFNDPSNVAHIAMKPENFMKQLDASCRAQVTTATDGNILRDGYAPFCKHVFVENFTPLQVNTLPINEEIRPLIESGYQARTSKELPVLVRYVTKGNYETSTGKPLPVAKYLDIILYSREQIIKESASMDAPAPKYTQEWAVISVKPQDVAHELPMNPITVMRNGLGMDQGGSGKPIQREEYDRAVAYWQDHVAVRHTAVSRIESKPPSDSTSSDSKPGAAKEK